MCLILSPLAVCSLNLSVSSFTFSSGNASIFSFRFLFARSRRSVEPSFTHSFSFIHHLAFSVRFCSKSIAPSVAFPGRLIRSRNFMNFESWIAPIHVSDHLADHALCIFNDCGLFPYVDSRIVLAPSKLYHALYN